MLEGGDSTTKRRQGRAFTAAGRVAIGRGTVNGLDASRLARRSLRTCTLFLLAPLLRFEPEPLASAAQVNRDRYRDVVDPGVLNDSIPSAARFDMAIGIKPQSHPGLPLEPSVDVLRESPFGRELVKVELVGGDGERHRGWFGTEIDFPIHCERAASQFGPCLPQSDLRAGDLNEPGHLFECGVGVRQRQRCGLRTDVHGIANVLGGTESEIHLHGPSTLRPNVLPDGRGHEGNRFEEIGRQGAIIGLELDPARLGVGVGIPTDGPSSPRRVRDGAGQDDLRPIRFNAATQAMEGKLGPPILSDRDLAIR